MHTLLPSRHGVTREGRRKNINRKMGGEEARLHSVKMCRKKGELTREPNRLDGEG